MDKFNLANYSFNPHAIPYLVSGLFVLILGIVVFHRKASSLTHISFAVFALTIAMWLLGWFVSYHANNPSTAFFWTKILWIGVIFISPSMYFFAVSILDLPQKKKRMIFGYLLFLPFLFALPFDAVISGRKRRYPKIIRFFSDIFSSFPFCLRYRLMLLFRAFGVIGGRTTRRRAFLSYPFFLFSFRKCFSYFGAMSSFSAIQVSRLFSTDKSVFFLSRFLLFTWAHLIT